MIAPQKAYSPDELMARAWLRDLGSENHPDYNERPVRALFRIAKAQQDYIAQQFQPAPTAATDGSPHSTHFPCSEPTEPGGGLLSCDPSGPDASGGDTQRHVQPGESGDGSLSLPPDCEHGPWIVEDDGLSDAHRERADLWFALGGWAGIVVLLAGSLALIWYGTMALIGG